MPFGSVLVLFEREFSLLGPALAVSPASLCFLFSPRGCFRGFLSRMVSFLVVSGQYDCPLTLASSRPFSLRRCLGE